MNICRRIGAAILSAALAASLGLSLLPVTAGAAWESSGTGDINIRVHFNPGGNVFNTDQSESGVRAQGYRLYQIATVSEDGKSFVYGTEYRGLPGVYISNSLTPNNAYEVIPEDWTIVQRVGGYINQNKPEPDFAAPFINGVATFTKLPAGLYLGTGSQAQFGRTIYTPRPFVICLPYQVSSSDTVPAGSGVQAGILYTDLDITVKPVTDTAPTDGHGGQPPSPPPSDNPPSDNPPSDNPPSDNPPADNPPPGVDIPDEPVPLVDIPDEPTPLVEIPDEPTPQSPATPPKPTTTTPNKPKLPQTGALWWPVPVMGGSGAVLMCAGLVGRRKSK